MKIRRQNLLVGFLTGFSVIPQVDFVQFSIVCSYDDPNSPDNAQSCHCEYENKITSILVNSLLSKKISKYSEKFATIKNKIQKQNSEAGPVCRILMKHPKSNKTKHVELFP